MNTDSSGNVIPNSEENVNAITSFVDNSNVYGSRVNDSDQLRSNDGTGKLKMNINGNRLLPKIRGHEDMDPDRYRAGNGLYTPAYLVSVFFQVHLEKRGRGYLLRRDE